MPPVAHIDRDETLNLIEKGGVIRHFVRKVRVTGLVSQDHSVLIEAINQLGPDFRVPTILPNDLGAGFEMLVLTNRDVSLLDGDPGTVDITLTYDHVLDGDHQELGLSPIIYGRSATSLKHKKTNFYRSHGLIEAPIQQILTGFTYPDGTSGPINPSTNQPYPRDTYGRGGKTFYQGGELDAYVPQKNFKFGGYMNTQNPDIISNKFEGHVNSVTWKGKPPRTWLCTSCEHEAVGPARHKFHFEMQHDDDGWDPLVSFIDPETDRPPPGLIFGFGYYYVYYLPETDFNRTFEQFYDGFQRLH